MSPDANLKSELSNPKFPRRWFRFSLLTLFVVLTIGCLLLGAVANRAQRQRRAVEKVRAAGGQVFYRYQTPANPLFPVPDPPGPAWLVNRLGIDYFDDVVWVLFSSNSEIDPISETDPTDDLRTWDLAQLSGFPKLELLDLDGARLSPNDCRALGGLTSLRHLSLTGTNIGDEGLASIARLGSLESLWLGHTQVSDASLDDLARFPKLLELSVVRTQVSPEGVERLQQSLPNCTIDY